MALNSDIFFILITKYVCYSYSQYIYIYGNYWVNIKLALYKQVFIGLTICIDYRLIQCVLFSSYTICLTFISVNDFISYVCVCLYTLYVGHHFRFFKQRKPFYQQIRQHDDFTFSRSLHSTILLANVAFFFLLQVSNVW